MFGHVGPVTPDIVEEIPIKTVAEVVSARLLGHAAAEFSTLISLIRISDIANSRRITCLCYLDYDNVFPMSHFLHTQKFIHD